MQTGAPGSEGGEGAGDQDSCFLSSLSFQPQQKRPFPCMAATQAQRGLMAGPLLQPLLILVLSLALGSARQAGEAGLGGLPLPLASQSPPSLPRAPLSKESLSQDPSPAAAASHGDEILGGGPSLPAPPDSRGLGALQAASCPQCLSHQMLGSPPGQTLSWVPEQVPSIPLHLQLQLSSLCSVSASVCLCKSPSDSSALPGGLLSMFLSMSLPRKGCWG